MPNPSTPSGPSIIDYGPGNGGNLGKNTDEDLSGLWDDPGSGGSGSGGSGSYQTKTCKLVVKYNLNGGDGTPPSDSVQTYSGVKKEVTFKATVENYPSDDYSIPITKTVNNTTYYFLGWSTSSSATTPSYEPGDVITKTWPASGSGSSGTTPYTLYAVWVNKNVFIYMPDEFSNERHSKYSIKQTGNNTLRGALFTRKGYTQTKWTDRYSPSINVGGTYYSGVSGVTVLYPLWQAKTYQIIYKNNGGTGSDITDSATYDSDYTVKNDIFTKNGYYIEQWNEAEDGSLSNWYPGETYTFQRDPEDGKITLYAQWSGYKYYVLYDDGTNGAIISSLTGVISTNLEIDANDCLVSSGNNMHKDSDDILYVTYPDTMLYEMDEESLGHYSIAVYGSPFYTDRRPISKYGYTFDGWEADDGTILTKQNVWMDAYSFGSNPVWTLRKNVVLKPIWSPNYPYGKIFFGDKESLDYGIVVENPPDYYWPEYSYTHNKSNGRNGDILTDPKKYENVPKTYNIAVCSNEGFYKAASNLSKFLHSHREKGYVRLEDSYEPDVYMMAVYEESGSLTNLLSEAGRATITFNCKPQKFLFSGDRSIEIKNSGTNINNPTDNASLPILVIEGSGSINISGVDLEIVSNFNKIILDCESCDAIDSFGRNMNYYLAFDEPIKLYPGDNLITYEGYIKRISVIPRWWRV